MISSYIQTLNKIEVGNELELTIVWLTAWNFIAAKKKRGMLIINKHYAILINLY